MRTKAITVLQLAMISFCLSSISLLADQRVYFAPNRIVIQVQTGVTLETVNGKVTTNNLVLQAVLDTVKAVSSEDCFPFDKGGSRLSRTYILNLETNTDVLAAVKSLSAVECVRNVQPDYIYQCHATPTDSSYPNQWGSLIIETSTAWDLFTGNDRVIVADVDSGVDYRHEDLAANMWKNTNEIPNNGVDDDGNGYIDDVLGWDFTSFKYSITTWGSGEDASSFTRWYWKSEDNDPGDDGRNYDYYGDDELNAHGTHVAGIIGAVANNTTSGSENIVGVLWNCKIMAVQAADTYGSLDSSWAAKAIRYAADNGAQVINMSFGGISQAGIEYEALQYAHNKGVVLCASAGNDNAMTLSYPASTENVISVAATDRNDKRSIWPGVNSGSNYNSAVDISAPGTGILSTTPGNSYESWNGTSMACPFVSGAAGLIIGYGETLGKKFTPAQVEYILKEGADNIDAENPAYIGYLGAGRLNINNSLLVVQTMPSMLSSILIQPVDDPTASDIVVTEHTSRNFQAIGVYSDGSTKDLTSEVTWMVRPIRYGSFSSIVPGRFSALQVPDDREVVITVLLNNNDGNYVSDQVVTIENDPDASPVSISGLDTIDPLSSASYKAIYQTPDGINTDVTSQVTWTIVQGTEYANFDSSQPGVLMTSSSSAGKTLIIKATYIDSSVRDIFTQIKTITVNQISHQVAGLFLTAPDSLTAGSPVQLAAKLIMAGQSQTVDVTALSTWSSSPTAAGEFDDPANNPGRFIPGNVSSTTVVTLSVQYTINGQVYTARLETVVVPATAKSAAAELTDFDSEDPEEQTDLVSSLPCSLPGLMIMAGMLFSGLLIVREK